MARRDRWSSCFTAVPDRRATWRPSREVSRTSVTCSNRSSGGAAASHPELVRRIALVGCGTFGEEARRQFQMTLGRRIQPDLQQKLERIADESTDPDERLMRAARLLLPSVYSYDLLTQDTDGRRR